MTEDTVDAIERHHFHGSGNGITQDHSITFGETQKMSIKTFFPVLLMANLILKNEQHQHFSLQAFSKSMYN